MSFRTGQSSQYGNTAIATEDAYSSEGAGILSVIDQHSSFEGTFRSDRDLRIDGTVTGTIECRGMLFISQGAHVSATVNAENITVAGEIDGTLNCAGMLRLLPSARVRGEVTTFALVINEGAVYEGDLHMAKGKPEPKSEPAPRPTPVVAEAPPAPERPSTESAQPSTFIRRLGGSETAWDAGEQEATTPASAPEGEGGK